MKIKVSFTEYQFREEVIDIPDDIIFGGNVYTARRYIEGIILDNYMTANHCLEDDCDMEVIKEDNS